MFLCDLICITLRLIGLITYLITFAFKNLIEISVKTLLLAKAINNAKILFRAKTEQFFVMVLLDADAFIIVEFQIEIIRRLREENASGK